MTDSPSAMWGQRSGANAYFYGTDPNEFLHPSLPLLPSGTAMCLAEGEVRNAVFLTDACCQVSSVDLTEAGTRMTRFLAQ